MNPRPFLMRHRPALLVGSVLLLLLLGLAGPLAAGKPTGEPISPWLEIGPDPFMAGEYQVVVAKIRNTNEEYDSSARRAPIQVQAGDVFQIDLGSACVRQILDVLAVDSSMAGGWSVVPPVAHAGSVVEIQFDGPPEFFDPDDYVDVQVKVWNWNLSGDCSIPPGEPGHPPVRSCGAELRAVGSYQAYQPEVIAAAAEMACPRVGPVGPIGPTGRQGPTGPTGIQGSQGPIGSTGPIGNQGLRGDRGSVGPTGPTGPQGDVGPQGTRGPIGETGLQGPQV